MVHAIEADTISLWFDVTGTSIIARDTLHADTLNFNSLSANLVIVLFSLKIN